MAETAKNIPDGEEQTAPEGVARDILSQGEAVPEPETGGIEKGAPAPPETDGETPAPNVTVVSFAEARREAEKLAAGKSAEAPLHEEQAPAKKERGGRPPKAAKAGKSEKAPGTEPETEQKKPKQARAAHPPKGMEEVSAQDETPAEPALPRDASEGKDKETVVYLSLSELHPFKNHPFQVRDDAEMRTLAESVKAEGVNQPAIVRPREDGGYEIVTGHRRHRASELAGYANIPCIVRNYTDDEAIMKMTEDNLSHRDAILPSERAKSLKMQVETISHKGVKGDGRRSTDIVGERNSTDGKPMTGKQVQRYIQLTKLVPELMGLADTGKLSFTPAVEFSFIKPKNQKYIAVSIEGQQSSPNVRQAQKMRELDKDNKLNPDVIDGILCEEKKEEIKVIISSQELSQYFGKEKTPREMKDQIITLLDAWKEKQPPELTAPVKKPEQSR
jgi:ParB-like chromosome segregation protein Spo0J